MGLHRHLGFARESSARERFGSTGSSRRWSPVAIIAVTLHRSERSNCAKLSVLAAASRRITRGSSYWPSSIKLSASNTRVCQISSSAAGASRSTTFSALRNSGTTSGFAARRRAEASWILGARGAQVVVAVQLRAQLDGAFERASDSSYESMFEYDSTDAFQQARPALRVGRELDLGVLEARREQFARGDVAASALVRIGGPEDADQVARDDVRFARFEVRAFARAPRLLAGRDRRLQRVAQLAVVRRCWT
jgi:hypothetical protein